MMNWFWMNQRWNQDRIVNKLWINCINLINESILDELWINFETIVNEYSEWIMNLLCLNYEWILNE